jgi:adenine-specific DNA-methyltransferase
LRINYDPSDPLKTLIESFSPQNLTAFFREKNRDFKPATEILSALEDTQFVQGEKLGYIPFNDFENLGIYTLQVNHDLKERSGKKVQYDFAKKY